LTCKAKAKAKDLSFKDKPKAKNVIYKAKAKDLTFKAKAKDFIFKAKANTKDLTFNAKNQGLTWQGNIGAYASYIGLFQYCELFVVHRLINSFFNFLFYYCIGCSLM